MRRWSYLRRTCLGAVLGHRSVLVASEQIADSFQHVAGLDAARRAGSEQLKAIARDMTTPLVWTTSELSVPAFDPAFGFIPSATIHWSQFRPRAESREPRH